MADLLSARQVAERLGILPSTWRLYVREGRAPQPDGRIGARPGWLPETVESWSAGRVGRRWPRVDHETGHLLPATDPRHGTHRGYAAGCRCPRCREGWRLYWWRRRRDARVPLREEYLFDVRSEVHGIPARYTAGCRCPECVAAWRAYQREWSARGR